MIHVTAKNNKFKIQCRFTDNHWVKGMPSRRFRRKDKTWEGATVARNVDYLMDLEKMGKVVMDEAAKAACQESMDRRLRRTEERFPAWYPFKTKPRELQAKGLDTIWGLPVFALLCEMGTGKSKMIIDWFSGKVMCGELKALVVFCPTAIRDNWVDEFADHCPIPDYEIAVVDVVDPKNRRSTQEFVEKETVGPKILVCGIESVQQMARDGRSYNQVLDFVTNDCNKPYATAVDESHFIQNHDTNRWENINNLSSAATYKAIGTGTETDGSPLGLYGQFEYLDPEILGFGDYYSFKSRYTIKGGYENRQVVGYQNVDELIELIEPFVYQCTKDEAGDIPPKTYMPTRYVKLTKEQAQLCKEIKESGQTAISRNGDSIEVVTKGVLAIYTAIQQVCCGHIGYGEEELNIKGEPIIRRRKARVVDWKRNPKIRELLSVSNEIRGKALIWCKYRPEIEDVAAALRSKYGDESVIEYHGGISRDDRTIAKKKFKEDPKARFFVVMASVGGTGLTFNEAKTTIYMSNSFKLRDRQQTEDRNHRIGQDSKVVYIDIVADNKVERNIMRALKDKKDLANYIREKLKGGSNPSELM